MHAAELNTLLQQAHEDWTNGRVEDAVARLRQINARFPHSLDAAAGLAEILLARGETEEALEWYDYAIGLAPDSRELYLGRGNALLAIQRFAEAADALERAADLGPAAAELLDALGNLCMQRGMWERACRTYRQLIALAPFQVEPHCRLALALGQRRLWDEALATIDHACKIAPQMPSVWLDAALLYRLTARYDDAERCYARVRALAPNAPGLLQAEAELLVELGRTDEAIRQFESRLAELPGQARLHSALLLLKHYDPTVNPDDLFAAHRGWRKRFAEPLTPANPESPSSAEPEKRLRIGYLSPDFHQHPVAAFILPLLRAHDRTRVNTVCFSCCMSPDRMTRALRAHAEEWHDIGRLSDADAAALIRRERIDILVDLAGHTGNHRLQLFARRPAPVQVTYLGYPDTTGLDTIDYRLTDAMADPPGATEAWHSEKLLRLEPGFLCYAPAPDAPEPSPPPSLKNGFVTFGSCNNLAKLSPPCLTLWARLLQTIPEARLLLKTKALGHEPTRKRILDAFGAHGIASGRIETIGYTRDYQAHLQVYARIDVALDPFPYNGTATTCDTLWTGCPVVTLAGKTHVARVGASILHSIGCDNWIAASEDEFLRIAAGLARTPERLSKWRGEARPRLQNSPLLDAPRFTAALEAAYRRIWRRYCEDGTANARGESPAR